MERKAVGRFFLRELRVEYGRGANKELVDGWRVVGVLDEGPAAAPPSKIVIPSFIEGKPVLRLSGMLFTNRDVEHLTVPDTVTHIDELALSKSALRTLHLGARVRILGEDAVAGAQFLESVTVSRFNRTFFTDNGNLYRKKTKGLVIGVNDSILPGTTEIEPSAFHGRKIPGRAIRIPDSVASIGEYAFAGCTIKEVAIPSSVAVVGSKAFSGLNLNVFKLEEGGAPILLKRDAALNSFIKRILLLKKEVAAEGNIFDVAHTEEIEIAGGKFLESPFHQSGMNVNHTPLRRITFNLHEDATVCLEPLFRGVLHAEMSKYDGRTTLIRSGDDWLEEAYW